MNIRKIMVALALSENSGAIFNYAAGIAERFDAKLIVISIINSRDLDAIESVSTMGYNVDTEQYIEDIKKERREDIDNIIGKSGFPHSRVSVIFKTGNPTEEILAHILTESVDLVVLGVKGRTNLDSVFIGSVADKIFRNSPVPVLSFRSEKIARKLKRKIEKYCD